MSNLGIALEKIQPDVIFKVCLEILKQQSFYNAFILTADHIIKLDTPLGNLKFTNKGLKDPVFGMPIPEVMLNDDIKATADYLEYLAKFIVLAHSGGSGEGSGVTLEVPDVHTLKCINKGAGRTSKVPDEPSDASSSSSSNSEIAKDDEVTVKPIVVTKNADYVTMADEVQPVDQLTRDEVHGANIKPVIEVQADVQMSEDTIKSEVQSMVDVPVKQATPSVLRHPLVDSTVTLIPDTTTEPPSQPPPTQPKLIKIKQMMKKSHNPNSHDDDTPLGNKVYRLKRKVEAMSKLNIQVAIDKFVEARLKQIKLPKGIPNFKKIKLEKVAKQNVPKTSWNKTATAIYDKKKRVVSLSIDEDDIDMIFGKSCQMKRKRDDHDKDPSPNADKDPKKRQRKPDSYKDDKD
ncbi:hypothetical protein Tco_0413504 [Tanacetum coccineum]